MFRFDGQELPPKLHDSIVVHSQRKQFISCSHRGVTAAWEPELFSASLCAWKNRSGCAQTACRVHGQELHSKVDGTLVAHSRRGPPVPCTHIGATVFRTLGLLRSRSRRAKNHNRSV